MTISYTMSNVNEKAGLHTAGAIMRHVSPFADQPSHRNTDALSADFIDKWVTPYYMEIGTHTDAEWILSIKEIKADISIEDCLALLGDFNWRTRLVGAYFAAVKGYMELIDIIGIHLLKSEVCCVGHIYALTLAYFNTEKSIEYLRKYLDYYLTRPDLYFDQKNVIEAMLFLDGENVSGNTIKYIDSWRLFEQKRAQPEKRMLAGIAKVWEKITGSGGGKNIHNLTTSYFEKQVSVLRALSV